MSHDTCPSSLSSATPLFSELELACMPRLCRRGLLVASGVTMRIPLAACCLLPLLLRPSCALPEVWPRPARDTNAETRLRVGPGRLTWRARGAARPRACLF